ncbi:hypothetical protein Bca101_027951 [Brassica carinata]
MALQNIGASNRLAKVMNIGETGTTLPKDGLPSLKAKVTSIKTNDLDIPEALGRPASYSTRKKETKRQFRSLLASGFKSLYDQELIEEEFVLEWYQNGLTGVYKSSHVWNNVKPFVEWLHSAKSESKLV